MRPDPFLWSDLGVALERARIAARLSAAGTTSEIAKLLLGDVREALGADSAVVAVPTDDTRQVVLAAEGVPAAVTRALSALSGTEPFPIVEAYRCGEPLFAESAAAVAASFPPLPRLPGAGAMACLPLRTPGGAAGAVGFGYRGERRFGPRDRAALDDLSRDVATAMERARLRETERAARTRLEVLAEASALLLENAADLPALLGTVTRLVHQATGDPCFVQVLGEDGELASGPTTVTHPDPKARAALEVALRSGPEAPGRIAEVVLGRGETLQLAALDREPLHDVAGGHLQAFADRFPVHGLLVAPLRTRGRPFGVLAVVRHRRGAPYTDHDRLLVEGVAGRAALAIAYARLNASHAAARARAEQAASRTARLQVVTSRLAGTAGVREVAAVAAALAIEAAGAAAGGVALVRPGRGDLELHWRRGLAGEAAGTVLTRVLDHDGPAEACTRTGRAVYHEDLHAAGPTLAPELERGPPDGALAVLPLRVHGEVAGSMVLRFDAPRAFEAEERAFLENLADQCSQALARARLWEREHEWARRQSALADISRALSEAHGDVRRLLAAVATRVGAELDALCCISLVPGPAQAELRAVHHPDAELRRAIEEAITVDGSGWAIGPPPDALVGGEGSRTPDLDPAAWPAGPALREVLSERSPRGIAAAPLTIDGRVQGVLFASRYGNSPRLGGADRWFLEEVAARAAVAIAQTREREALASERQRLAEVLSRAEEAIRAKDEFLAMLSHELRNPLAPIVTALHLMRLRADAAGTAREREVIERQVAHLVRLVDDLLDVSRMTRGKVRLELRVVDAGEVVSRAVELASPLLEERRHALEVVVEPGLRLHADPNRVAQVVSNLLTNAAKYTDPGGRVTVRAARDGDLARIAVSDTGIGLSPALVPRIFDLFVQGERDLDRAPGGLGIGLTIVRTMVELHGGHVRAESEGVGRGSTFTAWLPLAAAAELAARPATPAPAPARAGVRVLVVDDNQDAAELLAEALGERGHEPHVAFDGPSALALADRIHPRVALLDLGLPVMDGYELARRLRASPDGRDLILVAVTGYGQEMDRRASALAGFAEHLVKPVELERVCAAVERLLGDA
jgi:signal transduction histidine kinase